MIYVQNKIFHSRKRKLKAKKTTFKLPQPKWKNSEEKKRIWCEGSKKTLNSQLFPVRFAGGLCQMCRILLSLPRIQRILQVRLYAREICSNDTEIIFKNSIQLIFFWMSITFSQNVIKLVQRCLNFFLFGKSWISFLLKKLHSSSFHKLLINSLLIFGGRLFLRLVTVSRELRLHNSFQELLLAVLKWLSSLQKVGEKMKLKKRSKRNQSL